MKNCSFNIARGAWLLNRTAWASPSRVGNVVVLELRPPQPVPPNYKGGAGTYVFLAEGERWLKQSLEACITVPNRTGPELAVILEGALCSLRRKCAVLS